MIKGGLKKITSHPRLVLLTVAAALVILWAVPSSGPLEDLPTDSFFRLTKVIKIKVCETKGKKKKNSKICLESSFAMTASGFVVAEHEEEGSYVMTAAHFCDSSDDLKNIKLDPTQDIFYKPEVSLVSEDYIATDVRGIEHKVSVVGATSPSKDDICMLYGASIEDAPLPLASSLPDNGEKVYNMAAPTGYSFKNMVPIFEGRYSGINPEGWAIYTIPVTGGSSGSPVLNRAGEVVGMIVMRLTRFHHVSLSPQRAAMEEFMKKAIKGHEDSKCLCSQPKER